MAPKGSNKARSVDHEDHIADIYDGKRSLSSGASPTDIGDVSTPYHLIECKTTGGHEQDIRRQEEGLEPKRSTLLKQFLKVSEEAYAGGYNPLMALRFWAPESPISDSKGWVDLVVELASDHATGMKVLRGIADGD